MERVKLDYELKINYIVMFKTWYRPLLKVLRSNYMFNIMAFLHELYQSPEFPRPRKSEVFEVFDKVKFKDVRVVILTDEPFPNTKGNGIALATRQSEYLKPSSITLEVEKCIERTIYNGCNLSFDLTLDHWLDQGVLPLHASLTTKFVKPNNHTNLWKEFTRAVITALNDSNPGLIFILLGTEAKKFKPLISEKKHYVFSYHDPLWSIRQKKDWNCPYFKEANKILIDNNGPDFGIVW